MIYLIHFDKPYKHSRHYLGYHSGTLQSLATRLERHRHGDGARLLQVLRTEGITWSLVRVWDGGRDVERRLKKNHGVRCCPVCHERDAFKSRIKKLQPFLYATDKHNFYSGNNAGQLF